MCCFFSPPQMFYVLKCYSTALKDLPRRDRALNELIGRVWFELITPLIKSYSMVNKFSIGSIFFFCRVKCRHFNLKMRANKLKSILALRPPPPWINWVCVCVLYWRWTKSVRWIFHIKSTFSACFSISTPNNAACLLPVCIETNTKVYYHWLCTLALLLYM